MFLSLLLTIGMIKEPNLAIDIPVNLFTGKVEIEDKHSIRKNDLYPGEIALRYYYRDDAYHSSTSGKNSARLYQKKNVGMVFEFSVNPYGTVYFVRDSEHTYRPLYGGEFCNPVNSSGSAVNHPSNISVTSVDDIVVVTYLDGRKLIYKSEHGERGCDCKGEHYSLEKEYDRRGNVTKACAIDQGAKEVIQSYDKDRNCVSVYSFKRWEEGKFYYLDLCTNNENRTYVFKWINKKYRFVELKNRGVSLEKAEYYGGGNRLLHRWIDTKNGMYEFTHKDGRVSSLLWKGVNRSVRYSITYTDNSTVVTYPGEKIIYTYDSDCRLASIEDQAGMRAQFYYNDIGEIIRKEYSQNGRIYYARDFQFDSRHNLIKFVEWIDGREDIYWYEYDKYCRKVKEINSKGLTTTYSYKEGTFFCTNIEEALDGILIQRTKYDYDSCNRLIKEVVEDGEASERIFCRIKRYAYDATSEAKNRPIKITKSYVDTYTGREKSLGGKVYEYRNGKIIHIKKIDENENVIGVEDFTNTPDGISYRKDMLGKETYFTYDSLSRLIEKKEGKRKTVYTYLNGELPKNITETLISGEKRSLDYTYDVNGNIKKSVHSVYGIDKFSIDRLGRTLKKNKDIFEYDILNRIVKTVDSTGVTRYEYGNGTPVQSIHYSDETVEEATALDDDGLVILERGRDGIERVKTYDRLGNLIKEQLDEKVYTYYYKGRLLLKKCGPHGYIHTYRYDGAGRVIEEDGAVKAHYKYNIFSSVIYKRIFGVEHHYRYNAAGLMVEEKVGERQITYTYDTDGNIVTKKVGHEEEITYEYDGYKRAVKAVYPEASVNCMQYGNKRKETSNRCGTVSKEVYDEKGNTISAAEIDRDGEVIFTVEHIYSDANLCIHSAYKSYGKEEVYKEIATAYNRFGDLLEERVEDEFGEYITKYNYNSSRQLIEKIKPDGISIYYNYDTYGRRSSIWSSDCTINYHIKYDLLDREVFVKDLIHGINIERKYDSMSNLLEEKFSDGMRIWYSYKDGLRRRCHVEENGYIEYQYSTGGSLLSIDRYDEEYTYKYSHRFEYNISGQVVNEILPLNLFHSISSYKNGVCIQKSSPFHHRQATVEYDLVKKVERKYDTVTYEYDKLQNLIMVNGKPQTKVKLQEKIISAGIELDRCGRIKAHGKSKYTYDALDRMTAAYNKQLEKGESYFYDYYGRLRKERGKRVIEYLYDGEHEIGEFENGEIQNLAIIDYKTNKKVALELKGKIFAPLYDMFNNILGIVDVNRRGLREVYLYDPYGSEKIYDEKDAEVYKEDSINPWRYKGIRKFCFNTLCPFVGRNYSPTLKMFLSRDPLKQSFHLSPYSYCYNNPLKYEDVDGLYADVYSLSNRGGNRLPPLIKKRLQEAFSFEKNEQKSIYFVNGLSTDEDYTNACADYMEQYFDQDITPYYRTCKDSVFGVIAEFFGSNKKANKLAMQIRSDLSSSASEVYLFGHSAGGSTIKRALKLLSDAELQKISVVTFGSAALIDPAKVKSATNYYSSRDYFLIILQEILHPIDSYNHVNLIHSQTDSGYMDHSLMDATYRDKWIGSLSKIKIY